MVTIVVLINFALSLLLGYVAIKLWQAQEILRFISNRLNEYEQATHGALSPAPENIYLGQQSVNQLRQTHQGLKFKLQQIQQIINLMIIARQLWQGSFWLQLSISRRKK
ncbi:hypothetical protein B6N60_03060 [Richelia sinica FACHB-800]|uniref:Uncharacterized protein n=1 Tax=Richelia sinica FACHB-800 TaxID=1357546 RepID=A0A975T925_9NOST|nr:hypothetical protein [Richelia sinica]MBD2665001.1 hypothetical protein [Richelia sinica FACHB-800]QXE24355.1 hypothetical protein B6N60_03060 [Richelia sinica FACHB-800]